MLETDSALRGRRIEVGLLEGAAAPGLAVFRTRNLREVERLHVLCATKTDSRNAPTEINTNIVFCKEIQKASLQTTAPGPALALMQPWE